MKIVTLAYPIRNGRVLLGMKKRGLGRGWLNGFGGHVELGEAAHDAAVRELKEECGLIAGQIEHVGTVDFHYNDKEDLRAQVFLVKTWAGEIIETEEMMPHWFSMDDLPFGAMWTDDKHWLPYALTGWRVNAKFTFDGEELFRVDIALRRDFDDGNKRPLDGRSGVGRRR